VKQHVFFGRFRFNFRNVVAAGVESMQRGTAIALGTAMRVTAHVVTAVRPVWHTPVPDATPRVYFANHGSHGDVVLIWATLPTGLRQVTRPVAGRDYWDASPLRRFLGRHVFNALLIDRDTAPSTLSPLKAMLDSLHRGESLLMFPEGTRNTGDELLLPLKCGVFHLGQSCPDVELVPVWIHNARRAMPKGSWVPAPVLCTVSYGNPLRVESGEAREAFMRRAELALLGLRHKEGSA
jgi:1-acyl-sn-glycerol-3-phosphate acyltransferase